MQSIRVNKAKLIKQENKYKSYGTQEGTQCPPFFTKMYRAIQGTVKLGDETNLLRITFRSGILRKKTKRRFVKKLVKPKL